MLTSRAGRRRCGWVPDRPDHRDLWYAAPALVLSQLPPRVDLRPRCPPVYDQGRLGSCTANALAAAIQFDRMRQRLDPFRPSRLFIYYNERAMEGTVRIDAGAAIRDGVKSVGRLGDCPERDWPYVPARFAVKPSAPAYARALRYRAVHYHRIAHELPQMKSCLAEGFPFVFGISIYWNFPVHSTTGVIPMPGHADPAHDGHVIVAVGYDDRRRVFLIRNSWGVRWGRRGYGTIPYEYLLRRDLSQDFWSIRVVA
jgi:C1A family cysteine protease